MLVDGHERLKKLTWVQHRNREVKIMQQEWRGQWTYHIGIGTNSPDDLHQDNICPRCYETIGLHSPQPSQQLFQGEHNFPTVMWELYWLVDHLKQ